jgi:glycerate kinase
MTNFDERLRGVEVTVACDVNNPLCGNDGASAVFGPQKGATPEDIKQLDAALSRFADVVEHDLGVSVRERSGAGAAGGLGAGLMAFLDAHLAAGVDIVLDAVGLDAALENSDLVITGEGRIDHSTIFNKTPVGVAERAKKRGIPVIAIAGGLGVGYRETHEKGLDAAFTLVSGPMSLDDAMADTANLLADVTEEIMRTIEVGRSLKS